MDDRSIAWMISGGARAQTRDERFRQEHRVALADQARERDDRPWAVRPAAWRQRLTAWFRRPGGGQVTRTPDCCPA